MTEDVEIAGGSITLGRLLKLAGAVDSGAQARELIAAGQVRVDGAVERRRGAQLGHGTRVEVGPGDATAFRVVAVPDRAAPPR